MACGQIWGGLYREPVSFHAMQQKPLRPTLLCAPKLWGQGRRQGRRAYFRTWATNCVHHVCWQPFHDPSSVSAQSAVCSRQRACASTMCIKEYQGCPNSAYACVSARPEGKHLSVERDLLGLCLPRRLSRDSLFLSGGILNYYIRRPFNYQ